MEFRDEFNNKFVLSLSNTNILSFFFDMLLSDYIFK